MNFLIANGVDKNLEIAADWIVKAVKQNHGNAQYALGVMLMKGIYFDQNIDEAKELFVKAIDNGVDAAKRKLEALAAG
jgi:TPR repeat protein